MIGLTKLGLKTSVRFQHALCLVLIICLLYILMNRFPDIDVIFFKLKKLKKAKPVSVFKTCIACNCAIMDSFKSQTPGEINSSLKEEF